MVKRDPNPVSYADRDFFQALRDDPNLDFFIGSLVIGKTSKHRVIPAALRLET